MPQPRTPEPRSPAAEQLADRQADEGETVNPIWLTAAALLAAFDEPAAEAGDLTESLSGMLDFDVAGELPGTEGSGTGASTASARWSAGELQPSDAWADGAWADASGLPAWRLLGDDPALLADDLAHGLVGASQAIVSPAAAWGGGAFPDAIAGQAFGQIQLAPGHDLIFLDRLSYARSEKADKGGGNGGGKGNKGSGDSSEPDALSEYLSGDPGGYNILIDFKGAWTSVLQDAFTDAADLISDLILGDLADVFYRGQIIDDLKITAEIVEIDGVDGILGQAGPTAIRTADYLPAAGLMEFDSADADAYFALDLWDEIVLHEMLHTVGFGSVWTYLGLVEGSGTSDPSFTGEQATLAYRALFDADDATGVPLEQDGGPGTVESHWDEEVFGAELMTGYLDAAGNYLSDVTVASLADLGYETAALAAVA